MFDRRYKCEDGINIETTFLFSDFGDGWNINFLPADSESDKIWFWVHIEDTTFGNIDWLNRVNASIFVSKLTAFKLGFYRF